MPRVSCRISEVNSMVKERNRKGVIRLGDNHKLKNDMDQSPIAFPVPYGGVGPYMKSFKGSGYGVVFEDDGETGYFYATNEDHSQIFDALHLYNYGSFAQVNTKDLIFIVWNGRIKKAGIYYHERFQAVIDFGKQMACCRTGFPEPNRNWCKSSHDWKEDMIVGLEYKEIR